MRVDHNLQEGGQLRRRSLFSRTATIFLLSAIILFLATTATGTTKSDLSPATEQRDLDQSCRPIHRFNIHVDTDANIDADTDINHNPLKILKRKHDDTTKSNMDIDTPLPTQTQAQTEQHPFPASLYGTPGHAIASGLFVGMAGTCILWVVGFVVKVYVVWIGRAVWGVWRGMFGMGRRPGEVRGADQGRGMGQGQGRRGQVGMFGPRNFGVGVYGL